MFKWMTQEELHHYEGLCRYLFESHFRPDWQDPEYYRQQAKYLEKHPCRYHNLDYPTPDDPYTTAAADMYEEADKVECGFIGGEYI